MHPAGGRPSQRVVDPLSGWSTLSAGARPDRDAPALSAGALETNQLWRTSTGSRISSIGSVGMETILNYLSGGGLALAIEHISHA